MTKVYLYALIPTHETNVKKLPEVKGFDDKNALYTLPLEDITAIVSDLDGDEFTEENIKEKVNNDMPWLQDKALHHHKVLTRLHQDYTIIPLKFCTIYNNVGSLKESVASQKR
ncbi:GvpL/GvpF family gas vesicle protein [Virgibacillus halophilus]|uniref:GvpL/GvpF family gas vesicle protein n=1 Tax=Tigheibacillus halophilus TaxID=361280 RepID=A0ABU5C5M8_9BACI|nr:GvpL/GvpF family gas vesicle protein [Virgibacillus halophilus]